jgi:hypothetical protein
VQVAGAAWRAAMRTMAGVGDLVQRTGAVAQVEYSVVGRSRGRVASCVVCTWHVETRSAGFLVEPQNKSDGGFPSLGLKTGSAGLVIWVSKSPRQFLSLDIKTKWTSVCRLRHKTDRGRSARDMCRDLAACLASKQVWPEDWWRRDYGWCTWHHREVASEAS